jgi:hypothetical protein
MQNYCIKEAQKRDCETNPVKLPLPKWQKAVKADIIIT